MKWLIYAYAKQWAGVCLKKNVSFYELGNWCDRHSEDECVACLVVFIGHVSRHVDVFQEGFGIDFNKIMKEFCCSFTWRKN